ncbi:hypothetical protein EGJ27_09710 [Pseudomonas sp. v388]|nr:hypothetical protein EGJ27_09710 [Pseudomonas sp. v388]
MKSETSVLVVFSNVVPAIGYLRRSLWGFAGAARQIASKLAPANGPRGSQLAGEGGDSRGLLATILACVAVLSTPVMAENTVRFQGSVVHATCNLLPVSHTGQAAGQRLELAPGVTYQVQAAPNACNAEAAPFVAHYTPIQVSAPAASRSAEAGVITVTYQ